MCKRSWMTKGQALLSKAELEESLARKSKAWWAGSLKFLGKENGYRCETCKKTLVTINSDAGTTPVAIRCYSTDGCKGVSITMGYPPLKLKPPGLGAPTHEWYRPEQINDESEDEEVDHLMHGGLLLREVTGGEAQAESG